MYRRFFKRALDILCSILALLFFSPLLFLLTLIGVFAFRGRPFFLQKRPGKKDKSGKERIFSLLKFRTMTDKCDSQGNLLPDGARLTRYGQFLRSTSLDELPELFNILFGSMSFVGPRPQLVRDMVFMTEDQRRRHDVTPGLTGLAQVSGRNSISWEDKLHYDLVYIDSGISFTHDLAILFRTVKTVSHPDGVVREGTSSDTDFGDWLLARGRITREEYDAKQKEAKEWEKG